MTRWPTSRTTLWPPTPEPEAKQDKPGRPPFPAARASVHRRDYMKDKGGGPLRAIGRLRINFWIAMLLCLLCVGVTYGVTVSQERATTAATRTTPRP